MLRSLRVCLCRWLSCAVCVQWCGGWSGSAAAAAAVAGARWWRPRWPRAKPRRRRTAALPPASVEES